MQQETIDEIQEMTEDQFLAGPERDEDQGLDIDDIFAKPFGVVLVDWMVDAGHNGRISELFAAVLADPIDQVDYDGFSVVTLHDPACGVAAIVDGKLAGLYAGSDLVVRDEYRGEGIGSTLVAERYKRFGELPTWNHDNAGYSRAGEACHRAAFRMLRQEARQVPTL